MVGGTSLDALRAALNFMGAAWLDLVELSNTAPAAPLTA
jgi:hypothetical protein